MRRERKHEQGVIITLVAVFMLFVIVAMAALAIDVVTLYTARSEAQLAADATALAAARVFANSGMTSDPNAATDGFVGYAETASQTVATQVAMANSVGGGSLTGVVITFNDGSTTFATNPTVTVNVQKNNIPTYFARIWGKTQITVGASATAEAYNPVGASSVGGTPPPVAPICVKPWLLPNISPSAGGQIFNPANGAIVDTTLLGWESPIGSTRLGSDCTTNCGPTPPAPIRWKYYPGDPGDFTPPNASSVACTALCGVQPLPVEYCGLRTNAHLL